MSKDEMFVHFKFVGLCSRFAEEESVANIVGISSGSDQNLITNVS